MRRSCVRCATNAASTIFRARSWRPRCAGPSCSVKRKPSRCFRSQQRERRKRRCRRCVVRSWSPPSFRLRSLAGHRGASRPPWPIASGEARLQITYPQEGTLFPPESRRSDLRVGGQDGKRRSLGRRGPRRHRRRGAAGFGRRAALATFGGELEADQAAKPGARCRGDRRRRQPGAEARAVAGARAHPNVEGHGRRFALLSRGSAAVPDGRAGSIPHPLALRHHRRRRLARRSCCRTCPCAATATPSRTTGSVLGLDVDYGNDKGAYAIMPVSKHMVLDDAKIITWADYKREDGELTFGLLSRVSPTGRYVVSTVKDRSVFVAMPGPHVSRSSSFPSKASSSSTIGRRRPSRRCRAPTTRSTCRPTRSWSPDGKEIVFARATAYHAERLEQQNSALVDDKDVPEFTVDKKPFRYDLYRIPFNDGKGGTPQPLAGRLERRDEQLLPEVLARRQVDRLLQGQELHAAAARQRAVHRPGRGRRGAAPALQHARA